MRHAAYPIDEAMRDRWLSHMNAALDSCAMVAGQSAVDRLSADVAQEMRDYFVRAADHLRNV